MGKEDVVRNKVGFREILFREGQVRDFQGKVRSGSAMGYNGSGETGSALVYYGSGEENDVRAKVVDTETKALVEECQVRDSQCKVRFWRCIGLQWNEWSSQPEGRDGDLMA